MPGGTVIARNPLGGHRRLYSLRGTVEAHGEQVTGLWIFKNRMPILEVSVNPRQLEAFNNLARSQMRVDEVHRLEGIAGDLEIGMSEERIRNFPVGAAVGITFGYAGPVQQFFQGSDPLAVTNMQVITEDTVLENEVETPGFTF